MGTASLVKNWKETPLFSTEELKQLNFSGIPQHVALIPDGNRRWAKKNRIFPEEGHRLGADSLLNIIKAGHQIGIKTLTFFIFSTENWSRPKREIRAQMKLLEQSLILQKPNMIDNGVRFLSIGDLSKFPQHIVELVELTKNETCHCNNIDVVFAMNYGGRDDIKRAFVKMLDQYEQGKFSKDEVDEKMISRHLDTSQWSDPDLLIRTSGESRISNFLLWQLSYAEMYLTEKHWPEFTPRDLLRAVLDYQNRERRLGGC